MEYILENLGYICCFDEVSALDSENIDVSKTRVSLAQIDVTLNYRPSSYNSKFSQLVPALLKKHVIFYILYNLMD